MTTAGAIVTFVVTWWLIFLMTLPFGAVPEEHPQSGNVESAPARPRLLLKAAVTTVLAGLATWGIAWLIASEIVDIRPHSARHGWEPFLVSAMPSCPNFNQNTVS